MRRMNGPRLCRSETGKHITCGAVDSVRMEGGYASGLPCVEPSSTETRSLDVLDLLHGDIVAGPVFEAGGEEGVR